MYLKIECDQQLAELNIKFNGSLGSTVDAVVSTTPNPSSNMNTPRSSANDILERQSKVVGSGNSGSNDVVLPVTLDITNRDPIVDEDFASKTY